MSVLTPVHLQIEDLKKNPALYLKLFISLWGIHSVAYGFMNALSWSWDSFFDGVTQGFLFAVVTMLAWLFVSTLFRISFILLFKNPRAFMGGVGMFVFLLLLATHAFKWERGYFSSFQQDLLIPVVLLDLLCFGMMCVHAFSKEETASKGKSRLVFLVLCTALLLNIVTIANGVN